MRSLFLACAVVSIAFCAGTASADPPRPLYQPSHSRYTAPPPTQHTTLSRTYMPTRVAGPGNPAEVVPPSPRPDGWLGTSGPSGWGGPNPAYHKR